MNTGLEPPRRVEDDVLHALVSIIATTRRHWNLPDRQPAPEAAIGDGIEPEPYSSRPRPRTARTHRRARPSA